MNAPYLEVHYQFLRRVKRWLRDRCGECGRRFLWNDERHGFISSDTRYHATCMSLRHVRGQLEDLTKYVTFEADDTERWRVEYRLEGLRAQSGPASPVGGP